MVKKLPKRVFVYVCDYAKQEPIYAVATSQGDLPFDQSGQLVGVYELTDTKQWVVTGELL